MTSSASSFAGNALHSTAISKEAKCVIIDEFEARLVEYGCCVGLCNCETDSIGESLTKRACSNFDTLCILTFRVPRSDTVDFLMQESAFVNPMLRNSPWEHTRKSFKSSRDSLYPKRCKRAYCNMQPWPFLSKSVNADDVAQRWGTSG